MKTFWIIVFISVLFFGGTWIVLSGMHPKEKVFEITRNDDGAWSIRLGKAEGDFLRKIVVKIEDFIYGEATKYNPKGDFLPDQIDDKIKEEAKNRIVK